MRPRGRIRAPRRGLATKDDHVDFEGTWAELSSSLIEIHTKNASKLSFEVLYRSAYKLVLKKRGEDLYDKVADLERDRLDTEVRQIVMASIRPGLLLGGDILYAQGPDNELREAGERFLRGLRDVWEDHKLCMGMITDVLMYMDRVTCADHRKPSIYVTAMNLFRDYVVRSPAASDTDSTIASVLESTVLSMIHMERSGMIIERPLIRHCINMLEGLYDSDNEEESSKLYLTMFEPAFLAASRTFYATEGQELLSEVDASTFCRKVSARLREEEERCQYTLSPLTEPRIKNVIDEEIITKNIGDVINLEGSGVKYLLDNHRMSDLHKVYTLISRVDKRKVALTKAVQKRVVELGTEINEAAKAFSQAPSAPSKADPEKKSIKDGKRPTPEERPMNQQTAAAIKWVDDCLELKRQYDSVLAEAFEGDHGMQSCIASSFSDFINFIPRNSEYLSLFFDENLKKGIKGKTESEIDGLLANGITLLRYIRDKDLFETYYKKHLSRRLLMKRSVSMEAEQQIISKMKMEVGNTFTQRIEAMFKDVAISDDLSSSYKASIANRGDPDPKRIDLEMSVLTSTMWPMEIMTGRNGMAPSPCNFPREVDALKQSFEKFYLDKHSGRKLSWQPSMGTADIRAIFRKPNGKPVRHDLNVSTYAMIVLLLFNDLPEGGSLTYTEIQARTMIPDNDLIRNLQSLAVAPKTRVLRKDPMSKDVKPTDRFSYNEYFQSMYTKIKIGVVSGAGNRLENQDERKTTEKKLDDERGGTIEAAVVRTMKQRKTLSHSQLMTEVISQLASRFVPDVNMLKKRIESLIDREYLERVADSDPPAYAYMA
ncbi:Cullin-3 [Arachnomyces sp. PD_36]|nr:Cullin-3 [Arachnomyces sp. PD_36]